MPNEGYLRPDRAQRVKGKKPDPVNLKVVLSDRSARGLHERV